MNYHIDTLFSGHEKSAIRTFGWFCEVWQEFEGTVYTTPVFQTRDEARENASNWVDDNTNAIRLPGTALWLNFLSLSPTKEVKP